MRILRNIFIDPQEGCVRGRWFLLSAAAIWIGGNYYIFHVLARPH